MTPAVTTLSPPVDPARDHVRGSSRPVVTLVEYADFQCPYCGDAYPVVQELLDRFGDRLRFVFRHMPVSDLHPRARAAAQAAEAAAAQGRFWEMHDRLFEHQRELADSDLAAHAAAVGLDVDRFERELRDGIYLDRIDDDYRSGARSGVPSTPRFFVNGVIHLGSPTLPELQEAIAVELAASPKTDQ
jgi:Na+:H+ antiporter, NhaA family